ncbi:recombinase family protein [Planctomycetales bacterium ZRK34]|nr:recombinase family protein [Planctomycetales bacterium ZRK34]
MNKGKVFAYLRVSGKGQVDGDGFPRQRDAVSRWAKSNRCEVAREFRDEGVTGTKDGFDRPGLSDLFLAIRANGVRTIVVEKADRLARDLMVGEVILAEFRKLGVTVIAADSGTDLTVADGDPTRKLIRQVLGAVSEFEKSVIVQKLRAARERKRRAGERCEGRKPYGVTEEEQATIERIRQLRRKPRGGDRMGFRTVAKTLTAEGYPTRTGKPWSDSVVYNIAKREGIK